MRATDPTGALYGGLALRSVLAMTIDSRGKVTAASLEEASQCEALDKYTLEAFGVGASLPAPPRCDSEEPDLHFRLAFCLEVGKAGNVARSNEPTYATCTPQPWPTL
jgi:hypothetical protein